jgi:hypothetical protein
MCCCEAAWKLLREGRADVRAEGRGGGGWTARLELGTPLEAGGAAVRLLLVSCSRP